MVRRSFLFVLVAALIAYLFAFWQGMQETRDARLVDNVQVILQRATYNGMNTLKLPIDEIEPANIVNAARTQLPPNGHLDNHLVLTITPSGRSAQFSITATGEVDISQLKNFTRYHIEDNRIAHNTRWIP